MSKFRTMLMNGWVRRIEDDFFILEEDIGSKRKIFTPKRLQDCLLNQRVGLRASLNIKTKEKKLIAFCGLGEVAGIKKAKTRRLKAEAAYNEIQQEKNSVKTGSAKIGAINGRTPIMTDKKVKDFKNKVRNGGGSQAMNVSLDHEAMDKLDAKEQAEAIKKWRESNT